MNWNSIDEKIPKKFPILGLCECGDLWTVYKYKKGSYLDMWGTSITCLKYWSNDFGYIPDHRQSWR